MKKLNATLFGLGLLVSSLASANEISLMQGLYKSAKVKNGGGSSEITIGARYGLNEQNKTAYFGEGLITSRSYSGTGAPSGSTSMEIGGGMYYFLPKIGDRFIPYLTAKASFKNNKTIDATFTTETTESGLFYGADFGIRFRANDRYFINFETEMFESALSASTKNKNLATNAETETTRTELYADSTGFMRDMILGFGLML